MKPNIKEISIFVLVIIAILLLFGVLLYDYIPINQVIPTISEYDAPNEVKEQLKEIATEDTSDIVLTYEVTESDLGVYENTKNYDKGKVNPFSSYSSEQTTETQTGVTTNNSNGSSNSQTTNLNNQGSTQSSTTSNNSSKNTNTFYEDNGTK